MLIEFTTANVSSQQLAINSVMKCGLIRVMNHLQ